MSASSLRLPPTIAGSAKVYAESAFWNPGLPAAVFEAEPAELYLGEEQRRTRLREGGRRADRRPGRGLGAHRRLVPPAIRLLGIEASVAPVRWQEAAADPVGDRLTAYAPAPGVRRLGHERPRGRFRPGPGRIGPRLSAVGIRNLLHGRRAFPWLFRPARRAVRTLGPERRRVMV